MKSENDKAAQLDAVELIACEFLRFVFGNRRPESKDLAARHERIKGAVKSCGGALDAVVVARLFYRLETEATSLIGKVAALAQTTDPDALTAYGVPALLIENAKGVAAHHRRAKHKEIAANARQWKPDAEDKATYCAWALGLDEMRRKPRNVCDIRALPGFDVERWGRHNDKTLKDWWKSVFDGYLFEKGAPAKKNK